MVSKITFFQEFYRYIRHEPTRDREQSNLMMFKLAFYFRSGKVGGRYSVDHFLAIQ